MKGKEEMKLKDKRRKERRKEENTRRKEGS
jgi:hypothetical protein